MSFGSRKELIQNIVADKEFRDFYSESYLKKSIPFQLKTMRTERDWSQSKAGEILGKGQNAISRLESPSYGKLTVQTLIELARGFDVGLIIKFVPFSRLLREYEDVSFEALSSPSPTVQFPSELQALNEWSEEEVGEFWEAEETNVLSSPHFASEPVEQAKTNHYSLFYITDVPKIEAAETATLSSRTALGLSSIETSAGSIRRAS